MSDGPLPKYRALSTAGEIVSDPIQLLAAEKLQLLANRMASYNPPSRTDFFSFFTRKRGEVPKGLYMFGGVGRGKTMLMDIFFDTVLFEPKRRIHFHEFMAEVQDTITSTRKNFEGDPIPLVAQGIAVNAELLCLDEFQVTDIADAMILGRLFSNLFDRNVIVVATSNIPPSELYRDGLNRQLFLPFIAMLEERMEVMELEVTKDYRLEKLQGQQLYFTPCDVNARKALDKVWQRLTGSESGEPCELTFKGRKIPVRKTHLGAARFTFSELCETPLGAADYLLIAHTFHTVFVDDVPVLGPERRNEARRLINLIDAFYDNGVRLVVSAEAEPAELYTSGDGVKLFERTVSRLIEMRSEEYLAGLKLHS